MGFLSRVKGAMREREEIARYFAIEPSERPVTVYAEDDYTWNQLEGYVRALTRDHGCPVAYVTSHADDPLRARAPDGVTVFHVDELVPQFVPRIDSAVFVTTMPDLDRFHVKRPATSLCVYLFHSLNSTHMAYREGAFDAYDLIGLTGPYQRPELESRFAAIGRSDYELAEVGYYKLDRIAAGFASYEPAHPSSTTVVVAPSWGESNLLAMCGFELVASVAAAGFRTVVRPHPAFFESIYPQGESLVDDLQRRLAGHGDIVFETSITTESSFYEAALMISDWSGSAFEYAFGTERPVLFVDVPRKEFNPNWRATGLSPFEDRARATVGRILPVDDAASAGSVVGELLADAAGYRDRIREARDREIFNVGTAAAAGAALIEQASSRSHSR